MKNTVKQSVENLPKEILSLPRFIKTRADNPKRPEGSEWQKPENQRHYSELNGIIGFVASTTDDDSLIFFDFDHVLTESGDFVNDTSAKWFNVLHSSEYFCELSNSERGLHIFAKPTAGKFAKGRRELDLGDGAKLEIFFGTTKFCLCTGKPFNCEPQAPIAKGDVADKIFQTVLDAVAEQNKPKAKPARQSQNRNTTADATEYDAFRVPLMLDAIRRCICTLSQDQWLSFISAAKNLGVSYATVDEINRLDPEHYDEQENLSRWNSLTDPSFGIETLHGIAKSGGYNEQDVRRKWYQLHPEAAPMDDDEHENFVWTQDKIKSCPVNLRLPDGYTFDQRGITKILLSKKKNDPPKYIRVCNAPIIPTKKFRDPTKNTLEYGIAIFSDDQWRNIEVSAATIGDIRELSKILNLHGGLVDEPKIVSQFINAVIALNHDIPRIKSYSKTGWTDDDCTEFIYPHADAPYILRRAGFNYDKIFKPKGNPELWKQKFVEVCEHGGAVATAYFGVALSSAIAKPILGFNPSAHLFGKSGGGKTALLKFISSTYGNPRELVGTFAATPKNRLLTADALSGLPNFYDELETVQGKKAEEQLANDAYNFYDGKGNQANRRDGTARESFKFDSARLTSGERPYLKQHDLRGAFKRVLQLETRRILAPYQSTAELPLELLPDDLAADLHFFAESNFGHFGKIWTDFVTTHKAEIKAQYHHFAKFYAPLKTYEPTHLKILAGAFVSIEFFAVAIGIKSEFDEIEVQRNMRCIVDTLPTNAELDDTARALDFLRDFVAGHEKYFAREVQNKPEFNNEFTQTAFECYGKSFKNGEVAFLRNSLTQILEETGKFASAEKLINEFYDKGYLRHSDGKKTFPTFFNGKTTKMIRFVAGIISTAEQKEDTEEDVG